MHNKVESMKDYSDWERDDDVIELLKALKQLSFSTVNVQYEYWTAYHSLRRVMKVIQQRNESLAGYYKRFTTLVDVAESQWGTIVPPELADKAKSESEARHKTLACIFLSGADVKRYGKLVNDLNNSYLQGQKNYPETVESAVTMLSHYIGDTTKKTTSRETNEDEDTATSFNQTRAQQEAEESDSESATDNLTTRSRRTNWSG